MKVKFWYRCRGCGKDWSEVEEYEGKDVANWVGAHGIVVRHRCSDRQVGGVEFTKAKWEVV